MQRIFIIGCMLLLLGCSDTISEGDLGKLNGYWEIDQVVFPDGKIKDYKVNTSIDYIQLEGLQGFRKKVQPKFGGTYNTSDDAEPFAVLKKEGNFVLAYKNELSKWTERLLALSENKFTVRNEEGLMYSYKRFEPISIE